MLPAWMIADINKRDDEDDRRLSMGMECDLPHSDTHSVCEDDGVMQCGSGGGPAPPPPPDPMAEANAQMKLEQERARIAAEQKKAEDEQKAQDLVNQRAQFTSRLASSKAQAQNYGTTRLQALGINDDFGILPAYYGEIDRAASAVPDLDPNPGNYFGPALFESALGSARDATRRKLTRRYESTVPQGFDTNFIPDTADDALINAIIGEQYNDAYSTLDRARSRGQLNDTGFDAAVRGLGQSRSGAVARANDLGAGVLEKGRETLRNEDKMARQKIADYDFGDNFNPDFYEGRIKNDVNQFNSGLEGNLRNVLGGTSFFDPDSLILKGGKAQGAVNPGSTSLVDQMTEQERKKNSGSVGAF